MALVARPIPVASAQSVSAARPSARAGSLSGPVDSVTPSSASKIFDDSFATVVGFGEQGFPDHSHFPERRGGLPERRGGNDSGQQTRLPIIGIVESTTENFAKLIEMRDAPMINVNSGGESSSNKVPLDVINHAVSSYEASVNILTNAQNFRGETLSFNL